MQSSTTPITSHQTYKSSVSWGPGLCSCFLRRCFTPATSITKSSSWNTYVSHTSNCTPNNCHSPHALAVWLHIRCWMEAVQWRKCHWTRFAASHKWRIQSTSSMVAVHGCVVPRQHAPPAPHQGAASLGAASQPRPPPQSSTPPRQPHPAMTAGKGTGPKSCVCVESSGAM